MQISAQPPTGCSTTAADVGSFLLHAMQQIFFHNNSIKTNVAEHLKITLYKLHPNNQTTKKQNQMVGQGKGLGKGLAEAWQWPGKGLGLGRGLAAALQKTH
jgi:hypothetical protein